MEQFFVWTGIIIGLLIFVALIRVVKGPTVIDRLVAVNVIGAKTTVLLLIIGTLYGRLDMFVDISITYALLNFVASIAAARFFQRHGKLGLEETVTH